MVDQAFDKLVVDIRYVCRMLRSHPFFATAIVVVIALGLGLSLATYRAVKTVLLQQPAVAAPDRLLYVSSGGTSRFVGGLTPGDYSTIAQPTSALVGALAYGRDIAVSPVGDSVQTLLGEMVSDNYFQLLGVQPFLGAPISPAIADEPVVVISEGLWKSRFNSAPDVVGQELLLLPSLVGAISAKPTSYKVIGVVSSSYFGLLNAWERVQYWVPFRTRALEYQCDQPDIFERWPLAVVARVANGTSIEVATQALLAREEILRRVNHSNEADWRLVLATSRMSALPFQGARRLLPATAALAAGFVALLVLAAAIVNASGLLLARSVEHRQSAALRVALGISRLRLARQLLLETTLVALVAGLLAWPLGALLTHLAILSLPESVKAASMGEPLKASLLNSTEITFGVTGLVLVGVLIGLLPLRSSLRADIRPLIDHASDSSGGNTKSIQFGMLVPLVTLTVVVLAMAVTVSLHLDAVARGALGYDPDAVAFAEFQIARPPGCEQSPARAATFFSKRDKILSRILGEDVLPLGRTAVAMALPGQEGRTWILSNEGSSKGDDRHFYVSQNSVSEEFFDLLRIRVAAGRTFTGADQRGSAPVAVASESLARLLVPGGAVVGHFIALQAPGSSLQPVPIEIVGVVADARRIGADSTSNPTLYTPSSQWSAARIVVAAHPTGTSAIALAERLTSLDNDVSVSRAAGLRSVVDEQLRPQFAIASVLGYAAATAVVFSSVGLFGVVSCTMASRRREVCIRIALGASQWAAVGPSLRQIGLAVVVGLALGASLCLPLWRLAQHLQMGLPSLNLAAFAAIAAILLAVSCAASFLPARIAAQANPIELLKT